jgi:hypothetical protein
VENIVFQITKTDDNNIINIKCLYRFRNNPNVTDQITVAARQLGVPTVGFTEVPEDAVPTQEEITALQNARRIRRLN